MIDASDIILRRKGEQEPSISINLISKHGNTMGAITTDEEFDDPTLYIVDELEAASIKEANHVRMRKMLSAKEVVTKNMGDIFERKLKPLVSGKDEPFVLRHSETCHILNAMHWNLLCSSFQNKYLSTTCKNCHGITKSLPY